MSLENVRKLKIALYDSYGGFADKRIKKIDNGASFIVDDRSPNDHGADRKLYPWFCMIFAEVIDQDTIKVKMLGQVPEGAEVTDWLNSHDTQAGTANVEFLVKRSDEAELKELANAFRAIVAPQRRYAVPSYKYTCPRIANSLSRLADVLNRAWQDG